MTAKPAYDDPIPSTETQPMPRKLVLTLLLALTSFAPAQTKAPVYTPAEQAIVDQIKTLRATPRQRARHQDHHPRDSDQLAPPDQPQQTPPRRHARQPLH
jgi:hypothetical protein